MKTISFFNNKGGVGKTTSVLAVASHLAQHEHRVLVIDLDPQGNCSDTAGVFDGSEEAKTIHQLLTSSLHSVSFEQAKQTIVDTIKSSDLLGVDVLPSNILLDEFHDQMATAMNREYRLQKLMAYINDMYDFCLIDCQPSLSLLTTNALVASQHIVIPCDSSKYALTGMKNLMNKFNDIKHNCNPDLSILGIVNTKVDNRYKTAKKSREKLNEFFGNLMFETSIPRNAIVEKAQYEEKTLFAYGKQNAVSQAYFNLTQEVLHRV